VKARPLEVRLTSSEPQELKMTRDRIDGLVESSLAPFQRIHP
jgi:hypothetical protein